MFSKLSIRTLPAQSCFLNLVFWNKSWSCWDDDRGNVLLPCPVFLFLSFFPPPLYFLIPRGSVERSLTSQVFLLLAVVHVQGGHDDIPPVGLPVAGLLHPLHVVGEDRDEVLRPVPGGGRCWPSSGHFQRWVQLAWMTRSELTWLRWLACWPLVSRSAGRECFHLDQASFFMSRIRSFPSGWFSGRSIST